MRVVPMWPCNLAATPSRLNAKFNFMSLQKHSITTNEGGMQQGNSIVIYVTIYGSINDRRDKIEKKAQRKKNHGKRTKEEAKDYALID